MAQYSGDLTGQTLGSCVLEKRIAEGGMGTVYLARQTRPTRRVAVKVLQPHLATHSPAYQEFLARFRREADVIARLEHMNIMPIYEYDEHDGLVYLVMPYLTGGSMDDLLKRRGALPLSEAIHYIQQAGAALDYAHAQGIIHRDLKPANFLLHADGRLILADFGIARMMADSATGTTLTGTGALLGTPDYMAPEMVRGEAVDQRVDIYELGIVLFQMLSGHVPFSGNTTYAIIFKHVQEPLPLLHQLNPAIPPGVDSVLQKATAKNREHRYTTAQAVVQDLLNTSSTVSAYRGSYAQNNGPLVISSSHAPNGPTFPQLPAHYSAPTSPPAAYTASFQSEGQTATPATNPPIQADHKRQPPLPSRRPQPLLIFIGLVLAIALVIGGVLVGLQFSHGFPNGPIAPAPGSLLYTASSPGQNCDTNQGVWQDFDGIKIACHGSSTTLTNISTQGFLQGTFLTALPGKAYPANYVVQAQLQQNTTPDTRFGLYFRNQPGRQLGVYAFLINPVDGTWGAYVYDNKTGAEKRLTSGSFTYLHALVTLAVSANGSQFTFSANGTPLGSVTDTTYATGTAGIVVDQGGTVTASNFSLYGT
ncbi:MAG TPA: serine/threonine-protein kinase [Ktedonosporobacter sp.]|nr:serine/threonine-protein kinase [Ktedonosporobacter sp.]